MSRRDALIIAAAAVVLIAAAVVVWIMSSSRLDAKLLVVTGNQPGRMITSKLECRGNSAEGSGMYRFPKKAEAGCRQIKLLQKQLTRPQLPCPKNQQYGARVLLIKGTIEDKPVLFEQRNQTTCLGRVRQLARITPLVETAQASPRKPSFTVLINPPPPPALTNKESLQIDRKIDEQGIKAYQRNQARALKKVAKSSKMVPRCRLPLPDVYSTCYIQITLRPDETEMEALRRVRQANPDWFDNNQQPTIDVPASAKMSSKQREALSKQAEQLSLAR